MAQCIYCECRAEYPSRKCLSHQNGAELARKDVKLGDVIRLSDNPINPYTDATVIAITDGSITVFRPYVMVSDFVTTSGLIPYIGIEQFRIPIDHSARVKVIDRK
jgi:hypothetical protein